MIFSVKTIRVFTAPAGFGLFSGGFLLYKGLMMTTFFASSFAAGFCVCLVKMIWDKKRKISKKEIETPPDLRYWGNDYEKWLKQKGKTVKQKEVFKIGDTVLANINSGYRPKSLVYDIDETKLLIKAIVDRNRMTTLQWVEKERCEVLKEADKILYPHAWEDWRAYQLTKQQQQQQAWARRNEFN